jgi:hypothetical protein
MNGSKMPQGKKAGMKAGGAPKRPFGRKVSR